MSKYIKALSFAPILTLFMEIAFAAGPRVLDVLRETSRTVLEEEAAKDPYFREAYDSIRAFSAKVNRWHEIQEFKR